MSYDGDTGGTFTFIIKRTGERVPYDSNKIAIAMRKAFDSSSEPIDKQGIAQLIEEIETSLVKKLSNTNRNTIPAVEQIQDEIEQVLMRNLHYLTVRNFIIYRQKHAERRLSQTISKQKKINSITVKKRDGTIVPFNLNKILVTLRHLSCDIDTQKAPLDPIVLELEKNVFEGISSTDIEEALILSTTPFFECDPDYAIIASRLQRQKLYKEVFNKKIQAANSQEFELKFDQEYRLAFINNITKGMEEGCFTKQFLEFDLEYLSKELVLKRDDLLNYIGIRTLYERYFVRNGKDCIETPQAFWMRVAMGLSIEEENKNKSAKQFYQLMSELRYVPSTPTLFHSGLLHPQLSSCYISTVTDDLTHIFKCIGDNAQMAKWSGGIGNDWTPVRATNAHIKSTNVESQGIVPFLKIANDTTLAINRSGKRRGATCAYLETWHLDIEDFIDLRKNTGDERRRTHDMSTATWIPDLFMKRVDADEKWTLFSPDETPDLHNLYGAKFESRYKEYERMVSEGKIANFKTLNAKKLWRKILIRLFETGHPWITFKDPCNIRNTQDHVGVIHSSNLCTEITLNNSIEETAVCNLGSINLDKHVTKDGLNQYMLIDTIKIAMRMLDNVININFYPTKEARYSNEQHRPVGLGLMGLQNALFTLSLPFLGSKTLEFMDSTMEFISYHTILSSSELAKERGKYDSFEGSKWDRDILPFDTIEMLEQERGLEVEVNRTQTMDWNIVRNHIKEYGMRNSNTMAIAPTATISNIAGCFPCIEPIYKNIYVKSNMSGEFTIINQYLVKNLKQLGLWNPKMLDKIKYFDGNIDFIEEIPESLKNLYKETFEIDAITLLKLTAVRTKWIDQSQSHTVFIKGTSGKKLHDTYMQAWKMGLKTTYYLRSLGASQIEKSTLDPKEFGYTQTRVYDNKENNLNGLVEHNEKTKVAEATVSKNETRVLESEKSEVQNNGYNQEFSIPTQNLKEDNFVLNPKGAVSIVNQSCDILDQDCESCQ